MTANRVPDSQLMVDRRTDTLPRPLTSLVGRDQVCATVVEHLQRDEVRLLTLTGPGGMGKTRLAIEVAGDLGDDFHDGVHFVSLASIVEPALVLPTIASAIGLTSGSPEPILRRLSEAIGDLRMLLVLDNFEQVASAAGSVASLLGACPRLTVLATSRVPLRIGGEQEFVVPPLALAPSSSRESGPLYSPAVALFADRARAVQPGFEVSEANADVVAEICRRLGGMPLGIELAATRVKILAPEGILERLSTSLDILAGGPRDYPARLRSMRAAIAWSLELLHPHQRQLFRWLAPFAGGCPLDVAEAMAVEALGDAVPAIESAFDVVSALIDASLVSSEPNLVGGARLTMLEPIRQFAIEQLDASGEGEAARAWLARYCLELGDRATAAFTGWGPGAWHLRLQQALPNIRVALGWLQASGEVAGVLRLVIAHAPLWSALGQEQEGFRWLRRALDDGDAVDPEARIRALALAARLANALGDLDTAASLASEGLALADAEHDARGLADSLTVLGNIARGLGDGQRARSHYADALSRYRALDDTYSTGYVLIQLGKLGDLGTVGRHGDDDDLRRAMAHVEEALRIYGDLGNDWGVARALHQLGYLAYKNREYARAAHLSSESLAMLWAYDNGTEAASPIEDLADVAGATGYAETAAQFYGAAEALRERLGSPMWPSYRDEYDQEVLVARRALGERHFREALQRGRELPIETVIAEARALADTLASAPAHAAEAAQEVGPGDDHGLTGRELDVLRLLAAGESNQGIADALFISATTVKGHVRSMMVKLDLHSRTALVAWAHTNDLA